MTEELSPLPTSGWMLPAMGSAEAHRVVPDADWTIHRFSIAFFAVCHQLAVPARPEEVDAYPRCPRCAETRPAPSGPPGVPMSASAPAGSALAEPKPAEPRAKHALRTGCGQDEDVAPDVS